MATTTVRSNAMKGFNHPTPWPYAPPPPPPFIPFNVKTPDYPTNVQSNGYTGTESEPVKTVKSSSTSSSVPTTSITQTPSTPKSSFPSQNATKDLPPTPPTPSTSTVSSSCSPASASSTAVSIPSNIPSSEPVAPVVAGPKVLTHCSICGLGDNGQPLQLILPVDDADGVASFPSSSDLGLIMEFQLEWTDSPTNEDLLIFAHRFCLQHLGPDYFIDDTEPDQSPLVSSIISKRVGRLSLDTTRGVHCGICDLSGGIVICRKCSRATGSTEIIKVWHTTCMDRQLQQLKFMKNNLMTDDFLCHTCRPPKKERRSATHTVAASKPAVQQPQTTPTKPTEVAIANPIPIAASPEPTLSAIPPLMPTPLPSASPLSAPPPLPRDRISPPALRHRSCSRSPPPRSRSRTPPHRRHPVPVSPQRSLQPHCDRSRSRSPAHFQRAPSHSKSRSRSPRRRPSRDHELKTPRLPLFPSSTSTSALPPHMPYGRAPPDACYDFWNRGVCSKSNCDRPHYHPPHQVQKSLSPQLRRLSRSRSRSPSAPRRLSHQRSRSRSPVPAPTRRRSRSRSGSCSPRGSRSSPPRRRRSRSHSRSRSRSRSHHRDAVASSRYPPLPPKYDSHCFHGGYSTPEIDYQTPHQPTDDPIDFSPNEAAFCFVLNGLVLCESPFLITSNVPRKLIHHHPNLVMDELIRFKLITPSERLHLRWMSTMGPTRINVCMDSAQIAQEIIERASRRVTRTGGLVICPYQRRDAHSSTAHSSSSSSSTISDSDLLAELLTYFPTTEGEWIRPSRLSLLYASRHKGESFAKRTGRSTIFHFLQQFADLFDWQEGGSEDAQVRRRITPSTVQTYVPIKKRPSMDDQSSSVINHPAEIRQAHSNNTHSMTPTSTPPANTSFQATVAMLEDGEITHHESLAHEATNLRVVDMDVDGVATLSTTSASTTHQVLAPPPIVPNTSSVLSPTIKRGASDEKTEAALKVAGLSKPPSIERLRSHSDDLLFSPAPPQKPKLVVTKRAMTFGSSSPLPSSPTPAAAAAPAVTPSTSNEFITATGLSVAVKPKASDAVDPCFVLKDPSLNIWSCSICGCLTIGLESHSTHLRSLAHELGLIGQVVFQPNHHANTSVWCTTCRLSVIVSHADEHIKNRHSDLLELLLPESQSQSLPPRSPHKPVISTTPTNRVALIQYIPNAVTGIGAVDYEPTPEAKDHILVGLILPLLPPHTSITLTELGSRFHNEHPSRATFQAAIGMTLKCWLMNHPDSFIIEPVNTSGHCAVRRNTFTTDRHTNTPSTPTQRRIHKKSLSNPPVISHQPFLNAFASHIPTYYSPAAPEPHPARGPDGQILCCCRRPFRWSEQLEMMCCSGDDCPYGGWFHLTCLGITGEEANRIQRLTRWWCPFCEERE